MINGYMAISLDELADSILEDGIIDDEEVLQIKERIYEDGIIDRDEANFLFKLNDGTSGAENAASWKDLFIEAISDHVLKDETSPGVIDEEEAAWLINKIEGDGSYDENETALLLNIKNNATEIHPSLRFKINLVS